jgi:predicted MFS family arabinose efflux permease
MVSTVAAALIPLALGAFLLGAAYGPITPASSDVLARVTPPGWRSLVFSLKQTGVPLGGALAGVTVPIMVMHLGWTGTGPAVALACLAVALALQPWRAGLDQPVVVARWRPSLLGPIRQALSDRAIRRLAWASFLFAMLQHALGTFLVSHLVTSAGYALATAGGVLAAAQVAGALGRILWGVAADRVLAPRLVLTGLAIAMAVGAAGAALVDAATPLGVVLAIAVLFGASAVGWNGVYLAEVARLAPRTAVASVTGGCLAVTYLGVTIGPVVFTAMVAIGAGYAAGYWLHAVLALVAAILLVRR